MSTGPLRPRLAELAPSLRPIAYDVLGETSRIDLVESHSLSTKLAPIPVQTYLVQIADRVLHRPDTIPMLPAVTQRVTRRIPTTLTTTRRHQSLT